MTIGPDERDRVRDAVLEAGRIAMRFFRTDHARWEKSPGQVVTEADLAIDRYLHAALRRGSAEDGWLSEESADDRLRLVRRRVWVVDPIDGTRSFAAGLPEFAVSVALLVGDRPVLGFVHNPATGELFEAELGKGARLGGHTIRTSSTDRLEGARVCASRSESRRRPFEALLPGVELVTIGSLAYKLALVAAGRFDAYVSWRLSRDWDIAAAALLLEEAGGVLSDASGAPILLNRPETRHPGLLAAPRALHPRLVEATAPAFDDFRARRDGTLGPRGA